MTEEEFKLMQAGQFTELVMSEEEKAAYEAEENGSSDEIEDETAGTIDVDSNIQEDTNSTEEELEEDINGTEVAQESEVDTEKEDEVDGDTQTTETEDKSEDEADESKDDVDYKQQYEELMAKFEEAEAFRKKVTSDFKAGKKIVKGIDDPDKIVKNLQMSVGLTKKLEGYKTVKPLVKPLEERGLLQDTAKFDMLMKLADGDTEALKYYMKENNIDPIELDLDDEIKYDSRSTIASKEEMIFEDLYDTASTYGVAEKFSDVVLKEWDPDSAAKILSSENGMVLGQQLAEQMENGIYDEVTSIAEQLKLTDSSFRELNSIDQYNAASKIYNQQRAAANTTPEVEQQQIVADKVQESTEEKQQVDEEAIKAKIEAEVRAKIQAEMEAKAKEEEIAKQREEAVRASQGGTTVGNTQTDSIPKGTDDFRKYWKSLMNKG